MIMIVQTKMKSKKENMKLMNKLGNAQSKKLSMMRKRSLKSRR